MEWLKAIKERLENMKISILEFDDAGASDEEPVKGITMGHIRAWHDSYVELESDAHRDYQALEAENGRLSAALWRIARMCPDATQDITLAHVMAEEARAAVDVP